MIATPERRWFRFSLRTLFVVVTLFGLLGAWIRSQQKWISDREAALKSADPNYWTPEFNINPTPAPITLRPFGARGISGILIIDMERQPLLKEKLEELFPKAKIVKSNVPGPRPDAPIIVNGIPISESGTKIP